MKYKLSMKDFVKNTILPVKDRQSVYALANIGVLSIFEEGGKKMVEIDKKYLKENVETNDNNAIIIKANEKRNKKSTLILPSILIDMLLTVAKRKNIKVDEYLKYMFDKFSYLNDMLIHETKFEAFRIEVDEKAVESCKKMFGYINQIRSKNNGNRKENTRLGIFSLMFAMFIVFDLFGKLYPDLILNSSQNNQMNQN